MIDTQPIEVTDFSKGITDYILDGEKEKAAELDNFFYTEPGHEKLRTRWGSNIFVPTQIPLGEFRIALLEFLRNTNDDTDTLLTFADKKLYTPDGSGGWVEHTGPSGGELFNLGGTDTQVSLSEFQSLLLVANSAFASVQKVYFDNNGILQVRNAGLPELPSPATVIPPSGSGSTYSYAVIFRYSYEVGQTLYLDRGPVSFVTSVVSGGTINAGNTATVNLPTSLAADENWDVANIEVEIYRTGDASDNYFLSGTVPLGTPTYIDNVPDGTLITQGALYGDNGRISNSAPPKCKFVQVVNNTGYYAHIQEGGATDQYEIRQSIPGDPDSVPTNFLEKTEQEIKGLSSIYDRPMVLCRQYIYRADQFITSDGGGSIDLRRIDDRAGCVSNNSIVQTHKGLFWAGEVGFYWSDGFKVQKISDGINETYQKLVSNTVKGVRIHGDYDPNSERVFWTVSKDSVDSEPDTCFVLDLRFGIRSDSTFTTMTGGSSFRPTTVKFHKNPQSSSVRLFRGDTRGYVLYHEEGLYTDPMVDTTIADASEWIRTAIIYSYKSCFLDFGTKFLRKFVPRILVSADNTTNLSLAIESSNDNGRSRGDLKPIVYRQNIIWGSALPLWGDPTVRWNQQGVIEEWRRFPAKNLRCQYKQVSFSNADVTILDSTLLGNVITNGIAKTATLSGSFKFPPGIEEYFLSFGTEDRFRIIDVNDAIVTLDDPAGIFPADDSYSFIMSGIPKDEILVLNGYVLHWSPLSKSHTPFIAGGSSD